VIEVFALQVDLGAISGTGAATIKLTEPARQVERCRAAAVVAEERVQLTPECRVRTRYAASSSTSAGISVSGT